MTQSRAVFFVLSLLLAMAGCEGTRGQGEPVAPFKHSLQLVEEGSYLELPPDVFNDFTEATVEAWVKWNAFGNRYQRIFNYGEGGRDFGITTLTGTNTLWFVIGDPDDGLKVAKVENTLKAGEWTHVAAVAGSGGMKLYLNGALAATNPYTGCFKNLGPGNPGRLGQTVTAKVDDSPFDGELAEVRVWKTARSLEQIRENIAKALTGSEEGLAALWNFADPESPGRDASPNHHDGKLMGNARAAVPSIAVAAAQGGRPFAAANNRVLVLDGEGHVEIDAAVIPTAGDYTVECWAYASASARGGYRHLAAQDNQFFLGTNPDGKIRMGNSWENAGVSYPFDGWRHIAVAKHGKGTELYIDGVLVAKRNGLLPAPDQAATFRIGRQRQQASKDWMERWLGSIDEVRVWNVARTADQIRENITKQLTGDEPGLAGLWNFDDPVHPGRDASPNRHDGELAGSARTGEAAASAASVVQPRPGGKDALVLDGGNVGIESPSGWFADVSDNFTMEFWALPTLPRGDPDSVFPGQTGQRYVLLPSHGTVELGGDPHAGVGVSIGTDGVAVVEHAASYMPLVVEVPTPITDWVHVAVVYRDKTPTLYLNGSLAGTGPRSQRTVHPSLWSGHPHTRRYGAFAGVLDDVRLWNVPLTVEQIRANITTPVTGDAPGLLGWWNFDDPANRGRDASPHGRQVTVTAGTTAEVGGSGELAVVAGRLTDADGKPLRDAEVRVMQDGRAVGTVKSGENGNYFLLVSLKPAPCRLRASLEDLEAESAETDFVAGVNKLDLTLRDTLRISGTLSGPDGQPRRGVKVEAVGADGAVANFSVSDAAGKFIFRRLPDGEFKLRAAGVELNDGTALAVSADAPLAGLELILPATPTPQGPAEENRVLALDGSGAHLNLPAGMFSNLRDTTIEAWVRFDTLNGWHRFFSYGLISNDLYLGIENGLPDLQFGIWSRSAMWQHREVRGVIAMDQWCHVALSIGAGETRIYFNGTLAGTLPSAASFGGLPSRSPAYIGRWSNEGLGFTGGIDEVRVWAAARTGEEIRETQFRRLSGSEEGLAALWNFDDPDRPGRDATPNGFDGVMTGNAAARPESLPAAQEEVTQWASLSGAAVDVDGRPLIQVKVLAERGEEQVEAETDLLGNFAILVRASAEPWRVAATRGDLSAPLASIVLERGEHTLTLKLRDAAPLSGHLRAPGGSPLPTVVVQALPVLEETAPARSPGLRAALHALPGLKDFPSLPESVPPDLLRVDPLVDFPDSKPDAIAPPEFADGCFIRWSGWIRIPEAAEYVFHLESDDGSRLFIGDREVVNDGGLHAMEERSGRITLSAGDHELRLEYFNHVLLAGCRLSWSSVLQKASFSPASLLAEIRGLVSNQTDIII